MELELIQNAFHTGKQRDNRNKQNSDCRHVSDPPLLCLSGQFGLSFLQHGVEILGGIRRNLADLELDALGLEGLESLNVVIAHGDGVGDDDLALGVSHGTDVDFLDVDARPRWP